MDDSVDIRDLQIAVNLVSMRKNLNYLGVAGIAVGLFFIAILSDNDPQMPKLMIANLGIASLTEGILLILLPSPTVILIGCFSLVVIEVIIVLDKHSGHWLLFFLLIVWIFRTFIAYLDFRKKVPRRPTRATMTLMTSMVKDIRTRYVPTSKDIITMSDKSSTWRILLKGEMAVFVDVNGDQIAVKSREEDPLAAHRDSVNARVVEISSVVTGDQKLQMSAEHYQRYLAWKGIPAG